MYGAQNAKYFAVNQTAKTFKKLPLIKSFGEPGVLKHWWWEVEPSEGISAEKKCILETQSCITL